jgi:hypothetical protein
LKGLFQFFFYIKNSIQFFSSETFQRVLIQIIDQSFSNIYDEFAREMAKSSPAITTTTANSADNQL